MVSYYHFRLPFRTPFKTGGGDFSFREGILIHFHDGKLEALTEASPLPGFSKESLSSVKTYLLKTHTELVSFLKSPFSLVELRQFLNEMKSAPSIQFAISDLGRKILQLREKQPVNHPLFQFENRSVLVNDIVGYHDPDSTKLLILSALERGFNTIKIKIPSPSPQLAVTLREITSQNGDVKFRLDANQSWDFEKLQLFNKYYHNLPIEYVEEPFAMSSNKDIAQAKSNSDYPIALDESITNLNRLTKILQHFPDLFIIIKPMLLGNIFELLETISEHRSSYERVVVTSTLESAVGMDTISMLATSMGDHKRAHGLNTGQLFRKNLVTENEIRSGYLHLTEPLESPVTLNQIDPSMLTLL